MCPWLTVSRFHTLPRIIVIAIVLHQCMTKLDFTGDIHIECCNGNASPNHYQTTLLTAHKLSMVFTGWNITCCLRMQNICE